MVFTTGLSVPEGPVVLRDKSWLVAEMGDDRGCVTRVSPDGKEKRIVAKTGRPNGLAVDREGYIWVAESLQPSLLRLSLDGQVEVWLTECDGVPFLWPNDLCFGPDGALYMTDSGVTWGEFAPGGKVRSDLLNLKPDGRVYRIDVKARQVVQLDSGIRWANGIAFGPDNDLYVDETWTGMVYKYEWRNGKMGAREAFGNVLGDSPPEANKGPDGMKFGIDSKLYVAVFGKGNVAVLGQDGEVVERIETHGRMPTNVAFGPEHEMRIYVTEVEFGTIEVFDVDTEALPLYG